MKKIPGFIILAMMVACTQTPVEVNRYTIEQFFDNLSIGGGSFSADETRLLVSSNQTGIYNVFSLNVDGSGEQQLTFSDNESMFAISYFPEDDRFLYSADQGGNEISHIYMQDPDGTVTDLTPWEGAVSQFGGWTRDFKYFHFTSNKRDPRFFDMYRMDIVTFEPEIIYENRENLSPSSVSNTGKYMVLTQDLTTSNNEMYLLDPTSWCDPSKIIEPEERCRSVKNFSSRSSIFRKAILSRALSSSSNRFCMECITYSFQVWNKVIQLSSSSTGMIMAVVFSSVMAFTLLRVLSMQQIRDTVQTSPGLR